MSSTTLSRRGVRAAETPLRIDYAAYVEAMESAYHPSENPTGTVVLNVAENRLSWFALKEKIEAITSEDELPDWVKNKQKRLEKIQEAKKTLEEEAKRESEAKAKTTPKYRGGRKPKTPPGVPKDSAQRNLTDPESRIMKSPDGFQQCYNTQLAVDSENQVIVSHGVTNSATDRHQLVPALRSIKENLGRQARELSADGDYCSEDNLKEISRRHVRGYVSTGRHYHSDESGRRTPPKPGTRARAMWKRIRQARHRSRYRLRKQVVEPVFGQIKFARQFRQFLLRGHAKVSAEWSLICIAHNLLKLAKA